MSYGSAAQIAVTINPHGSELTLLSVTIAKGLSDWLAAHLLHDIQLQYWQLDLNHLAQHATPAADV